MIFARYYLVESTTTGISSFYVVSELIHQISRSDISIPYQNNEKQIFQYIHQYFSLVIPIVIINNFC